MTDRDFFYKALGLSEPWEVRDVKLDLGGRRVELEIGVKAGIAWGHDGLMLPIEGYEERTWRHLDSNRHTKRLMWLLDGLRSGVGPVMLMGGR